MKKYIKRSKISAKTSTRGRRIMASTGMSLEEMWDYLLDYVGVSEETL